MNQKSKFLSWAVFVFATLVAGCASKSYPPPSQDEAVPMEAEVPLPSSEPVIPQGGDIFSSALPTVHFDFDQAVIRSSDRALLQQAAETIRQQSGGQVSIEGHCDERGSAEYNLALGERRATAVKNYLRSLGIDGNRLSTVSYGKERPVDSGSGEEAWAKNRRADLVTNW